MKRADDERKNIFRYSDNSKKKIKLFNPKIDVEISIYFKGEDGIESIKSKEITGANTV